MNSFNNTELETLKAQMSVLKSHLSNEDIISDEMLNATIHAQAKSLSAKKSHYLIGAGVSFAMALFFLYAYIRIGEFSTIFIVLTEAWCLYFTTLNLINYKSNDHENLMNGSLTETTKNIISWRKKHSTQGLFTALAAAIWIPACLIEIWGDISTNVEHIVFVALIFTFVVSSTIGKYVKDCKVSKEILNQIEEINKA